MGAGQQRSSGVVLDLAGHGVDRHVRSAGSRPDEQHPGDQRRQTSSSCGQQQPGHPEGSEQRRSQAGPDPVQQPAREQHRGQGTNADEQQRNAKSPFADPGLESQAG